MEQDSTEYGSRSFWADGGDKTGKRSKSIDADRSGTLHLLVAAAFYVSGIIVGCVVFSHTFSADEIKNCVSGYNGGSLFGLFRTYSTEKLLTLAIMALMSVFAVGWLTIPALLAYRGLGAGIILCCLCAQGRIINIAYAAFCVGLPMTATAFLECCFAKRAMALSQTLFGSLAGQRGSRQALKSMCKSLFVISIALLVVSFLEALVVTLLDGCVK